MAEISRRRVAQGAAWSIPAVAVAASAPALAASPSDVVIPDCGKLVSLIGLQGGSTKPALTQNLVAGVNGYRGGTNLGISLGIWSIPGGSYVNASGQKITGFYMLPGQCGLTDCSLATVPTPEASGMVITADGTVYPGKVTAYTPYRCSPQTAGAGLSADITIATPMPYQASTGGCNPNNNLASDPVAISIPYSIVPVNGLTPVPLTGASTCCTYFNMTFDGSGGNCLPRTALTYGFSTTPLTGTAKLPYISAATPNYADVGQTVTLTGVNFTGATSVTVNGVPATFTVVNDTTITLTVPPKSGIWGTQYPIVVTNAAGSSDYTQWFHGNQ